MSVLLLAGGEQTQLRWHEDIVIRSVRFGRLLAPLTDRVNEALFINVVNAMAVEAERAPGQVASGR